MRTRDLKSEVKSRDLIEICVGEVAIGEDLVMTSGK